MDLVLGIKNLQRINKRFHRSPIKVNTHVGKLHNKESMYLC